MPPLGFLATFNRIMQEISTSLKIQVLQRVIFFLKYKYLNILWLYQKCFIITKNN